MLGYTGNGVYCTLGLAISQNADHCNGKAAAHITF